MGKFVIKKSELVKLIRESMEDIEDRANLEYFLSFNDDDLYWQWINDEISDSEAKTMMSSVHGIDYDPNVDYEDLYSGKSVNENKKKNKTVKLNQEGFKKLIKSLIKESYN